MSKLTLDEAIKHCLEVADEQSRLYSLCPCPCDGTKNCMSLKNGKDMGCVKCAAEHRQLAAWLQELKDLREENKVLTSECDRLIKEKGELLSKVSGGDVLKICQLEEQIKKWKEEYANLNKISYGFYKELKETKELLKLTIDTINHNLHKSCYNCSHFTSNCNCDIGKYLYGTGEKECEWEWKHMGEIINFLHD